MKLSQLAGYSSGDTYVTTLYQDWLLDNHNPTYSHKAKDFLAQQIGKPDRERKGTFSASSLGDCCRQQQFKYLGVKQERDYTPELLNVFHNGTWMHLRHQAAGLTAGYITGAEVPVKENVYGLSGTKDGMLDNGYGLELKSCNERTFSQVMTFGLLKKHVYQVGTYMLADDLETFSVVYENKNTQDLKEVIVHRDETLMTEIARRAEELINGTLNSQLFEMREDCAAKTGYIYKQCPFNKICPKVNSFEEAVE